jgi:hypothetical protein
LLLWDQSQQLVLDAVWEIKTIVHIAGFFESTFADKSVLTIWWTWTPSNMIGGIECSSRPLEY